MKVLFILLASFLFFGCSSDNQKKNIVSDKFKTQEVPEGSYPKFIALVQLKKPALFAQLLVDENGKTVVDQQLLEEINEEHAQALKDLKSISEDIEVLYSYKRVFNGMAIVAPIEKASQIERLASLKNFESDENFARPKLSETKAVSHLIKNIDKKNSVTYIHADKVHKMGITGKGITVGIIDTGIDFTHSMLGGVNGTVDDFKSVDPNLATPLFPNKKVVGGKDFVGREFSVSGIYFDKYIPKPDVNPIDQTGHGSHVAGSVAGIGNGEETYSGVAPDAQLYALKVFGDVDGSTSDSVVLASFEYAADPNNDFNLDDKLDVLNLSLGSGYGMPHEFYNLAVSNLVEAGTVVVASAGNSGDVPYITGSPGTSTDALSVAAGIDSMDHNWKAAAVEFFADGKSITLARAYESSFSVKIADLKNELLGKVVYTGGMADTDFPDDMVNKIKGNIAMIDRGKVSFSDKFKRAQLAGAVGVIVVNNKDEDAFAMGGGDSSFEFKIPGIMINKALGEQLKSLMPNQLVEINFSTGKVIEFPEVIGTITDFSSKGPRSLDSLLKPEVTAPGSQILSADVGTGKKGVMLSGTSMSGPHMAGVMALMKQKHKNLRVLDLKSMVMNSAIDMKDTLGAVYPLSRQGAGMVDASRAVTTKVATIPAAVSLGEHSIYSSKRIKYSLTVKNVSEKELVLSGAYVGSDKISMTNLEPMTLAPLESQEVRLAFSIRVDDSAMFELNGSVQFKTDVGETVARVPVMAIIDQASNINVQSFTYGLGSADGLQDSSLVLKNKSRFPGEVYPFNLLSRDERKRNATLTRLSTCDLEAVGFRFMPKEIPSEGGSSKITSLQLGVKLFNPLTDWQHCVVNVEFDIDMDGKTDFLLIGSRNDRNSIGSDTEDYVSFLLDNKIREQLIAKNLKDNLSDSSTPGKSVDLAPAVISSLGMLPMHHSTLAIVEVNSALVFAAGKKTAVRVSISNVRGGDVEETDTLVGGVDGWQLMDIAGQKTSFTVLPTKIELAAKSSVTTQIKVTTGEVYNPLVLFKPTNKFNFSQKNVDKQMDLVKPF